MSVMWGAFITKYENDITPRCAPETDPTGEMVVASTNNNTSNYHRTFDFFGAVVVVAGVLGCD
jgi:hypothetical protein